MNELEKEAEQTLLGCMLVDKNIISDVVKILTETGRFSTQTHNLIYNAIVTVHKDKRVDAVVVADYLDKMDDLNRVGGSDYLYELQAPIVETDSAVHYAEIVLEKAIRRDYSNKANHIRAVANDESKDIEKVAEAAESLLGIDYSHFKKNRIEVIEWGDISISEHEWLLPHWLPANTVSMFTGQGGAGKSWLTLQVVCQIACGVNNAFLNPKFEMPSDADDSIEPKHIILATYEDEPAEIKRRLQALKSGMEWIDGEREAIEQHLHIVDMRGAGSIWGPGIGNHIANTGDWLTAGNDLRKICEDKKARLLVIDPLSGAFGGNENDRTVVYDFVSSFRRWADIAKCAILLIGHLPKGAEARAAGFSGSTAWEASVRSMWKLEKNVSDDNEYWILEHIKSNYMSLQKKKYLGKSKDGWWQEVETEEEAIAKYKELQKHYEEEVNGKPITPNF